MTPALAKELVEALEAITRCGGWLYIPQGLADRAKAALVLARAKAETGTQEFEVTDDGRGRAMVGGRRLAFGGAGLALGLNAGMGDTVLSVGTRVRVELREGTDFATLLEVMTAHTILVCDACGKQTPATLATGWLQVGDVSVLKGTPDGAVIDKGLANGWLLCGFACLAKKLEAA